jgi:tetratricopeptide (TPR) repeat protein
MRFKDRLISKGHNKKAPNDHQEGPQGQLATTIDARALYKMDAQEFAKYAIDFDETVNANLSNSDDQKRLAANELLNEGVSLGDLGRGEDAVAAFDELLARFADEPAAREQVVCALFNKGNELYALRRYKDAVPAWDEFLARFPAIDELFARFADPAARQQLLFNKGFVLDLLSRYKDAIAAWDEFLARFADEPAARIQVAHALFHKADALVRLDRFREAIAVYNELFARFADAHEPEIAAVVHGGRTKFEIAKALEDHARQP